MVCDLCENPYPYMCAECNFDTDTTTDKQQQATDCGCNEPKVNLVWVGSGEDIQVQNG